MSARSGGAKPRAGEQRRKVVADNRRARFDYEILDTFEAGGEFHVDMIISPIDFKKVIVWPDNLPWETYCWLRDNGFEIIALHELPAPEKTTATPGIVTAEWSRLWPAEEVWVARTW